MELHYNAFISYRHAPLDIEIASEIQRRLERYPVPREIQKQTGKKRIDRIFRDKEELPITSDLNDDIGEALRNSDFLIVICSTNTASSAWVRREIETFLMTHDRRHVLTVLADGEPQDVIPDLLKSEELTVRGPDGTLRTERREIEPLSCDYRMRRSHARREELPRLAAALLGCAYDELRQRQRRRRIRQMVAGFSAALVLISAVAAYAIDRAIVIARQAERIEEEYRNTLITQSRYLAERSGELLAQGDRMGALQVALAALPEGEEDTSRPLVTEALFALHNAAYPYHVAQPDEFLAKCVLSADGSGRAWELQGISQKLSPGGTRLLAADSSGQIYIFDLNTDARLAALTPGDVLPEGGESGFLSADFLTENRIVLYLSAGAVCWDLETESAVWTAAYGQGVKGTLLYAQSLVDEAHGALLSVLWGDEGYHLCRLSAETGQVQCALSGDVPEHGLFGLSASLCVSPDGERAAVGFSANDFRADGEDAPPMLALIDLARESARWLSVEKGDVAALQFLSEDQICVLSADMGFADSIDNLFPYAVTAYRFSDTAPLWSVEGEAHAHREVGDEAFPTASLALWPRELSDGATEDLLIASLSGRLLLLAPESGEALRVTDFPDDILCLHPYDAGQLFAALRSGQLMVYLPVSASYSEMGSVSGMVQSAVYAPGLGEFYLSLSGSPQTVVMSDRIEDPGLATAELDLIDTVEYALGDGWEYRIVRETVGGADAEGFDAADAPQRLLFYLPLSDAPFAATDARGDIREMCVLHKENGEDVCYYLLEEEQGLTLCGWGLEQDKQVFTYDLGASSGTLYGLWEDKLVFWDYSALRLIDPSGKTEKALPMTERPTAWAFSPDGRYLALLSDEGFSMVDVSAMAWVKLPEALTALHTERYPSYGDLAFSPDGKRLAVWAGGETVIVDLESLKVAAQVGIPCRSGGKGLFLNDRTLLVYGDSGHLTTWDLETGAVIMEDPYGISGHPTLTRTQDYIRAVSGGDTYLYTFTEDGRIARYLTANHACLSPSGSELLSFYNRYGSGNVVSLISDTAFHIYPLYSLDEMVEKAKTLLNGKTLTQAERIRYFIDS